MKKLLLSIVCIIGFTGVTNTLRAQIYEPEGINIPGAWNGWTNSNDSGTMGNFRLTKRSFAGGQYMSAVNIQASGGDTTAGTYEMLFTSGPDANTYANKWADGGSLNIDGFTSLTYNGSANNSITVADGNYYTLIFDDNGYANSTVAVLKTGAVPISINSVSGVPDTAVTENEAVTITVELSAAKSAEEKIYIRYSTDGFQTSDAVEITNFSGGTTGTADIPGQALNSSVEFYVLTTTIDEASWDSKIDLATISYDNNAGDNYTYFYDATIQPLNNEKMVSRTPDLEWFSISDTSLYDLQLDNDSDFSSPLVDEEDLTDTTFTISTTLDSNTRYYWRFKDTTETSWTFTYSFTTVSEITLAKIQFPESAVINEGGTSTIYGQLTVPGVTSATGADSEIDVWFGLNETDSDPSSWGELTWEPASFNDDKSTTDEYSYTTSTDLEPGQYFYAFRFQYKDQGYVYGGLNGEWDGITNTSGELVVMDIPVLSSPADAATDIEVQPDLSWTASDTDIQEFNLQVATESGFSSPVIDESDLSSSSSTYSVTSALENETTYYWRVRSEYDTTASDWSAVFSFTTEAGLPSKIVLSSPSNAAIDISVEPDFSWGSDSNSDTYQIQISESNDFSGALVLDTDTLTLAQYSLGSDAALNYSDTYHWRVRGTSAAGSGAWSDTFSFTTESGLPSKITLAAPADGAIDISTKPSFDWDDDASSDLYQIQISESTDFGGVLIFDHDSISASQYIITDPDLLASAGTYYWRVQGLNDIGTGEWSDTLSFTTLNTIPELLSPADEATDIPVDQELLWKDIYGANHYDLQISEASDFTTTLIDSSAHPDTSFTTDSLLLETTYYWRVKANYSSGSSEWSGVRSFTTAGPPPLIPVLLNPDSASTNIGLEPLLSWQASVDAESYNLQLATSSDFSSGILADSSEIAGTEFQNEELNRATTYYWRVRAYNTEGGFGEWSSVFPFTTIPEIPSTPVLVAPEDSLASLATPVTFVWNTTDEADSYQFQYSETSAFTFSADSVLSDTTLTLDDLISAKTYYWRVRASNAGGNSAWSLPWIFDTGLGGYSGPALTSPENNTFDTDTALTFAWQELPGAQSYQLQVSDSSHFNTTLIDSSDIENAALALDGFSIAKTYYWRVRAMDANGSTDWSETSTFMTRGSSPLVPVIVSPADSADEQARTITFIWHPSVGASSYEFRFSEKEDLSVSLDSTISDTLLTMRALSQNTRYYWQIRAVNTYGSSTWTKLYTFKTGMDLPIAPVLIAPEDEEITELNIRFAWNTVANAESYQFQLSEADSFKVLLADSSLASLTFDVHDLAENTSYYWRVRSQNKAGYSPWSDTLSFTTMLITDIETDAIPTEFGLSQNYPNPFNPSTVISYQLAENSIVSLRVYDMLGREVAVLVNERRPAGEHAVTFNAHGLASGIYIYQLNAGEKTFTKRLTLIK